MTDFGDELSDWNGDFGGHGPDEPANTAEFADHGADVDSGVLEEDRDTAGDVDGEPSDGEAGDDEFGDDEFGDDEARDAQPPDERIDAGHAVQQRAVRARPIGQHWGRLAELWVPEPLRAARVDPGRRGALILLLVASVAAVMTAVGVWRNQPEPRPVPMAASAGASVIGSAGSVDRQVAAPSPGDVATPKEPAASPAPAPPTEIVVSVTGLVARNGLVKLPPGARVADAIAAAGGATADADLTGTNLAAKLVDGDSIVLGDAPSGSSTTLGDDTASAAGGHASSEGSGSTLVNLNTADEAALDSLPGVGPVMAQNILAWRDANRKFTSIEQLQEISGIGPSRYAQISPLVTL